jgi:hypothetical protein
VTPDIKVFVVVLQGAGDFSCYQGEREELGTPIILAAPVIEVETSRFKAGPDKG